MKAVLTPREFAEAIGVSESSVKRWVDNGEISATRTAGGHRRVSLGDAAQYIRQHGLRLVRPEILGLSEVAAFRGRKPAGRDLEDRLFECLRAGAEDEARGLLLGLYLEGESVAQIIDGPLRAAMARVGELWTREPSGVFWEHRATQITMHSLVRLRALQNVASDAAVAVGGAAPGDRYMLPSMAVATVLEAQGMRAVNLGADTPIATLALGVCDLDARLAWLSVSNASTPARLRAEVIDLLPEFADRGTALVVGGAEAKHLKLPSEDLLYVAGSMVELEALVRGMRLAASSAG
ncbi:MAG: excisionase family DNA-binding protein [Acidimicrobiia bacterium]|nr:excisionase family DNA-binding protein [Acidimicrobiia bacterium]